MYTECSIDFANVKSFSILTLTQRIYEASLKRKLSHFTEAYGEDVVGPGWRERLQLEQASLKEEEEEHVRDLKQLPENNLRELTWDFCDRRLKNDQSDLS